MSTITQRLVHLVICVALVLNFGCGAGGPKEPSAPTKPATVERVCCVTSYEYMSNGAICKILTICTDESGRTVTQNESVLDGKCMEPMEELK